MENYLLTDELNTDVGYSLVLGSSIGIILGTCAYLNRWFEKSEYKFFELANFDDTMDLLSDNG